MTDDANLSDLQHPDAQTLLATSDVARLAYNGPDGFPRVIPTGFLWTGSALIACTASTAPKVKSLRARPQVALTIDAGGPPRSLQIRGVASIEIVDGIPPEYLAAAAKSMSGDDLAGFEASVRAVYPQMARITVTPTRARYYDFGAGRVPPFLRRLLDAAS